MISLRRSGRVLAAAMFGLVAATAHAQTVRRPGDVLPDNIVRFKFGSTELTDASKAALDRLAAVLKKRAELNPVFLVGHADDRGPDGLNVELSRGRADVVRRALIKRGIRGARLKIEGVGSREPLSLAQTDSGRALNRRVEVWVTPRGPVARVGRVERRVEAREPAAPQWRRAEKNQQLRRLSRVRTLEHSSSEIVFPRDDLVTMGPNALAVIYGTPDATKASRRATADIELEAGSLFAALAEREGRVVDVRARSGQVRVRSKKTRVNANTRRKQSTIEVYDGESEVFSAGQQVTVPVGYGTRVRDGQPPEPPRLLPPPPEWTRSEPLFRLENEPIELAWRAPADHKAAEFQLGVGNDVAIDRPVRLQRIEGSTVSTTVLPGIYVARMAGIDDRDLVGVAGTPRTVVVLPSPRLLSTNEPVGRGRPDAAIRLAQPGTVRFFAPPKALISIAGKSSTVAVDVDLYASKTVVAGLKAADGGPMRYVPIPVEVPTHRVDATVGEPVRGGDGDALIPIDILVTDQNGHGVDGLDFRVGQVWAASDRLLTSTATGSVLAPCHCAVPAQTSPAEPLGDGRYRWTMTATAGAPMPSTIRFYAAQGARAVETELPPGIAMRAQSIKPTSRETRGWMTTLHAGTWLGTDEDPVFQLGLGVGARIPLFRTVSLDVWGLGRWFQRRRINDSFNVFPLTGRLALRYTGFRSQLYFGGGAGVRVGDIETRPVGEAFVGLLIPVSVVDIDLEGGYTAAGSTDDFDELAGWGVRIGLRWSPE